MLMEKLIRKQILKEHLEQVMEKVMLKDWQKATVMPRDFHRPKVMLKVIMRQMEKAKQNLQRRWGLRRRMGSAMPRPRQMERVRLKETKMQKVRERLMLMLKD